jgi:hypothetical protein
VTIGKLWRIINENKQQDRGYLIIEENVKINNKKSNILNLDHCSNFFFTLHNIMCAFSKINLSCLVKIY